jgi:heavy metal translocating P-type ATPase
MIGKQIINKHSTFVHIITERMARRALIVIAATGLFAGLAAWLLGWPELSRLLWTAGVAPTAAALAIFIIRDMVAGRMGVDAVALLSMVAALTLDQALAGAVVAMMYAGGGALEDIAVTRAEADLKSLSDRAPRIAHRRRGDAIEDAPVEDIAVNDRILVHAGEIVPVDGAVVSEGAILDESALTGEAAPVHRPRGELARSGTVNAGDSFELVATCVASDSAYAAIVEMVAAAQTAKAPFMRIADRFALFLFPISVGVAGGAWLFSGDPTRGLAVLVAATPCPLILAAPVAFIAGVSQAARRGVLIKGGAALEALAQVRTVLFDKTGTLTVGGARVAAIETAPGESADETLRLAASVEQASQHVVAAAIKAAAIAKGLKLQPPEQVRETLGSGLEGIVDGGAVRVGSKRLALGTGHTHAWAVRALRRASWRSALSVFVSVDGRPMGAILLADEIRRETPRAVQALRAAGVTRIVMVTGDRADTAESIGAALDLDEVLSERSPAEKVEAVACERRLARTLMVGDGINDAPALAAADVGVAMGARGASASSEAADVVVLVNRLDRVGEAIAIARRARRIALQSVWAGMGLSGVAVAAASVGWLSPVAGALVQEVIDVAVILNALRALKPGRVPQALAMREEAAAVQRQEHEIVEQSLDYLRQIADALDDAAPHQAVALIGQANRTVAQVIVRHEREDEKSVYPQLQGRLGKSEGGLDQMRGLSAMSRAHREILHLTRLLERLTTGLTVEDADRYLVRDAQRMIESIEALVRLHNAQEEDIYEYACSG